MKFNLTQKNFGSLLIFTSLISTIITTSPIILDELKFRLHLLSPPLSDSSDFTIAIPNLGIFSTITLNVNPWNKKQYQPALSHSVAHAQGSALPDQPGTVYLFGHSSGNFWEQTHNNPAFYRLHRLKLKDPVTLHYQNQDFTYLVIDRQIVPPGQIDVLTQSSSSDQLLVLQTCTPIGTDWNRLLIFARLIES